MTQIVAITLAGIVGALSPLVLRYVRLDGLSMSAVSYGVALGIALVAAWLTGDFKASRAGVVAVLSGSTAVWTVQQGVFVLLKQYMPQAVILPLPTPLPVPGPAPKAF